MTGLQICQLQLREIQKIRQLVKDEEELTKAISKQLLREQKAKQNDLKVEQAKQQRLQQQELTEEEKQHLKVKNC